MKLRRFISCALFALVLGAPAFAQSNFPQTLPPNTVVGRLGIGPGPAQAIPFSTFGQNILPPQAANTLLGNATGSTGVPTGVPVPNCGGLANALKWTAATGFGCNSISGGRTQVPTPLTLFVSPSGSDTTGDGSVGNPWKNPSKAYSTLQQNYDLSSCQQVTIQLIDGTHVGSNQLVGGVIGQCQPGQIAFKGNCTTPGNVLVQPTAATGYTFSAAFGAQYRIQCMKLDMTNNKANEALGADTTSIGAGSRILFGDPTRVAPSDVIFGFNVTPYNSVTVSFGGFVEFDNDFRIDPGLGQAIQTGSYTNGGTTISLGSATGVIIGMGLQSSLSGIPVDAYVGNLVSTTVTLACTNTTPCQASATQAGATITFSGGGQTFLDMGNGGQGYFNTNGQPDVSIIATLANYPFYTAGIFFINELSAINAQAITWASPELARGKCFTVQSLSHLDTGLQGVPYLPCLGNTYVQQTGTLTAGSAGLTVGSATGISVGQAVNGVAVPTGTWSAGSSTITVSSGTGICTGAHVWAPGILAGAVVQSIVTTTVTLNPCGSGGVVNKCVSGFPTYLSGSGTQMFITGCGVSNGSVVNSVTGTTIGISQPAVASGTQLLLFQGLVKPWYGSIYN